jgi:hypothetical protein
MTRDLGKWPEVVPAKCTPGGPSTIAYVPLPTLGVFYDPRTKEYHLAFYVPYSTRPRETLCGVRDRWIAAGDAEGRGKRCQKCGVALNTFLLGAMEDEEG